MPAAAAIAPAAEHPEHARSAVGALLLQQVLADPGWAVRLTAAELRGLTPLFWSNINPKGLNNTDHRRRGGPRQIG